MDKRLSKIFSLARPVTGLIDVGTDHGYIPLALCEAGFRGNIIASDINAGPLDAAIRTAARHGFESRIIFTLCPGLEKCDPDSVDTIVIAGMGGDMICGILDKAEWTMDPKYSLILQPMTRAEILRYWLANNGYEHSSHYVADDRFDYQIISAGYTGNNTPLSDSELYTGTVSDLKAYENASRLVRTQIERFRKEYRGLSLSARCAPEKLDFLQQVLEQLEKTEEELND